MAIKTGLKEAAPTTQELKRSVNEAIERYNIAKERFEFTTAAELKSDIAKMRRELKSR